MTPKVTIALVGAGRMGRLHARAVVASARARLGVVVDRHLDRAEAVAEAAGCRASDHLEDAFAYDSAIVATPAEEHVGPAVSLLAAGRPVLVEKPLAVDLADVEHILEASGRANVPVMCGFVERFNPAVVAAASLLGEAPARIVAHRQSAAVPRPTTPVALDLLIHDVDLAIRVMGEDEIADVIDLTPDAPQDRVGCRLGFVGGATAWLSAQQAAPERMRTFLIASGRQVLDLDLVHQTLSVTGSGGHRAALDTARPVDALARQLDYFLDLCAGHIDADRERHTLLAPHTVACHLLAQ